MPARTPPALADVGRLRNDVVAFTEALLTNHDGTPARPHPAQVEIMRGIVRETDIVTGRQFGKSTAMEWLGTWYAATRANRQVFIIGPSLEQARIIFNGIAAHFRRAPLKYLVVGKIIEHPFPRIRLSNGSEIHARGANSPQFIRGNRCHLALIDESAFIKDSTLTDVIDPMFTVTGKEEGAARIRISSPFGQGEFSRGFNRPNDARHQSFHFTSYDNPYADREMLDSIKARYGEESLLWRTEYLGIFADSDMAVFPWADIAAAYENWPADREYPDAARPAHRYVQGVDLAAMRDYFVATVLDITNPAAVPLVHMDRYQKRPYADVKATVRKNYHDYRHAKTLVDATTLARSVTEDLADIHAEGYVFGGNAAKHEVVQELARMLSERRLLLPYHRDIVDELRYFEYRVTPGKVIKAEAAHGHDDIVMSLALAAHLANIPTRMGLFSGVDLSPAGTLLPRIEDEFAGEEDPWAALFKDDDDADTD